MEPEEYTPEMLEEIEMQQQEQTEDSQEDSFLENQQLMDAYGSPVPDEKHNQHSFLHKSAFDTLNTEKVTFLDEYELGRPVFNIRFLLDLEDISHYYLDEVCRVLGVSNEISKYFRDKINNICDSGMSNRGFAQNMNVTRRMDTTKKRIKVQPSTEQGVKK